MSFRSAATRAHLDRERAFGDQLTRADPDDADAKDPLGFRIDDQLRQAIGPIERRRAAGGGPWDTSQSRP